MSCADCEGLRRWERTQTIRIARLEAALRRVREVRRESTGVLDVVNGALADGPSETNADAPRGTLAHAGNEARAEERSATVKWLRTAAAGIPGLREEAARALEGAANIIERGDHCP